MTSKNKIVEAYAGAEQELLTLSLPDRAMQLIRQLHRAFTDLRHHDAELAKDIEARQASHEILDKKTAALSRQADETAQALKAKDASICNANARIAALESEVKTLAKLIQGRLDGPAESAAHLQRCESLDIRVVRYMEYFQDECDPTPKTMCRRPPFGGSGGRRRTTRMWWNCRNGFLRIRPC